MIPRPFVALNQTNEYNLIEEDWRVSLQNVHEYIPSSSQARRVLIVHTSRYKLFYFALYRTLICLRNREFSVEGAFPTCNPRAAYIDKLELESVF